MVDRPLEDVRPLGPFIDLDSDEDLDVSSAGSETKPTEPGMGGNSDNELLKTAEKWYENISKEENKRKMMRNYLRSISKLTDSEIEDKLDEAGL